MFQTNGVGKIKTNILCQVTIFFRKSCHLWVNVEKKWYSQKMSEIATQQSALALHAGQLRLYTHTQNVRDRNKTERTSTECWTAKAIHTYSEYPICMAFPRQQWSRERASMLRLHVDYLPCLDA